MCWSFGPEILNMDRFGLQLGKVYLQSRIQTSFGFDSAAHAEVLELIASIPASVRIEKGIKKRSVIDLHLILHG